MGIYGRLRAEGEQAGRRFVTVDRRGDRATVVLDEPERLNGLSAGLVVQLKAALTALADDDEVRSVVITGAGPASARAATHG